MKLGWSDDFVVLDGASPALPQIRRVDAGRMAWIVVRWIRLAPPRSALYVLSREEFFARLSHTTVPYRPGTTALLADVFDLRSLPASGALPLGQRPAQIHRLDPGVAEWRTGQRYVEIRAQLAFGSAGSAIASVGGPDIALMPTGVTRGRPGAVKPVVRSAPPATRGVPPTTRGGPPATRGGTPPATRSGPEATRGGPTSADEGTAPIRYPSIEPEGAVRAGEPVVLVVDLLDEESATTEGFAAFGELPSDWSSFPVEVRLSSPGIEFDADGRATLLVRRNQTTVAARVTGRVQAGWPAGQGLLVKARFLLGQRLCGTATRTLALDGSEAPPVPDGTPPSVVQIDLAAAQPDLTVEISISDPDKPTRLAWSMWTAPFSGRPPKLNGVVNLGQKPEAEASALFTRFAKLDRGHHQEAIEGFGEELWGKAPREFQDLYWALCDHLNRPLTIQFISDDPHMPWELMNPFRPGEQHGPMALRHAVARWLLLYKGHMDNRLPQGSLLAMAPHYAAGRELPLAEAAAQQLVTQLGAKPLDGQRATLLQWLENPPDERVAVFFFTGHGAFSTDAVGASRLKLEGGTEITPMEVKRQKVTLGARDGTVVFLNACEVGATGSVLGNVGGWADAFLAREFGAFIAPLWAIDEEDAATVTTELMEAIVRQRQPLGAALRDLRAKYGAVSPTFYSYLLYGDVTARLGTA